MPQVKRSALVPFSAQQMFALVNDIEQYPRFMSGCKRARIVSQSGTEMVGELELSKAGISQRFTTRNKLDPPNSIDMQLVEGNFSSFHARWNFIDLGDQGSKLGLDMDFEFSSGLIDAAARALFNSTANNLVDALVGRANEVYGFE